MSHTALRLSLALASACLALPLAAQFVGYSLKGGPSIGTQRWENFDRQPLFAYHFDVQVESLSDVEPRTLYASLGYHQRGSAVRTRRYQGPDINGNTVDIPARTERYEFNNAVLALGAKQTYGLGQARAHVALALRGEYNVNTNLDDNPLANTAFAVFRPNDAFVTDFTYGIDLGGGLDISVSPSFDLLLEVRASPDFSRQYFQPPLTNVILPGQTNPTSVGELSIRNVSFELSAGIRFVRYNGPELEE